MTPGSPSKFQLNLNKPVVILLGPTAVGKTGTAIRLAEKYKAEIISADSRLLYRGMDIGTDKPSLDERSRIPHHLIDVAEPYEIWSLARFLESTHYLIKSIHQLNKLPILVGGSGQYIRALTQGWEIPKLPPNPKMRKVLEDWALDIGNEGMHKRLSVLDSKAAQIIDAYNLRRTIRAIEVILLTGKKFSDQRKRSRPNYQFLQIGLVRPRPDLYSRIDSRIEKMIMSGLVAEVKGLLESGYRPDLHAFGAIGYREIILYLKGEISLDDAVLQMKRSTRTLVRRQANWFKLDDPDIHWFDLSVQPVSEIEGLIKTWLNK